MSRALLEGNGLDCASDRARGQVRSILEGETARAPGNFFPGARVDTARAATFGRRVARFHRSLPALDVASSLRENRWCGIKRCYTARPLHVIGGRYVAG